MNKITIGAVIGAILIPGMAFASASITLVGGSVSFNQGQSYVEPGYSANSTLDGDITSSVVTSDNINGNRAGSYSVNYSVTDSVLDTANAFRSVTVNSIGGAANPCIWNGTCPCPIDYQTDPKAWKACVIQQYPKTADGSTLVCRLKELQPADKEKIQCAEKQAGFGEMLIKPDGTEVNLW